MADFRTEALATKKHKKARKKSVFPNFPEFLFKN